MSTKTAEVVLTANGAVVKKLLTDIQGDLDRVKVRVENLNASIAENNEQRKKLAAQNKTDTKEYENLVNATKKLNADLKTEEQHINALNSLQVTNIKNTEKIAAVLDNLTGTSMKKHKQVLGQLQQQYRNMNADSDKLDEVKAKIEKVTKAWRDEEAVLKGTRLRANELSAVMRNLGNTSLDKLHVALDTVTQDLRGMNANDPNRAKTELYFRQLSTEVNRYESRMKGARLGTEQFDAVMSHISTASLDKLHAALNTVTQDMNAMNLNDPNRARMEGYYRQLTDAVARYDASLKSATMTQEQFYKIYGNLRGSTPTEINSAKNYLQGKIASTPFDSPNMTIYREQLDLINKTVGEFSVREEKAAMSSQELNRNLQNLSRVPLEQLREMEKILQKNLDTFSSTDKALPKVQSDLAAVRAEMDKFKSSTQKTEMSEQELNAILRNLSGQTLESLNGALSMLKKQLLTIPTGTAEFKNMQGQIRQVQSEIDKSNGTIRTHNALWQTAARNIMAYVGVFGMFNFVRSKLQMIMDANLQMSDQLLQIRMVSGLAMKDVSKLSNELKNLDTRTTLSDLQQLSYEGSKLGMGQYGVSGLTSFTESANKMNVALKEQLGDDTLTSVSKMVETMGLLKKMDIGQAMEKVGSTMFMLSSSSTSTASNIMEFAKRMTAMSKIAGISTSALLALGSASDSMFLDPEISATTFIKLLQAVPENAKAIEKQLNITAGSIKNMVQQGKMMDAITLIFEKMHGQSTSQLAPMFKLLGSEGARMTYVMSAMAQNVDMLQKHLNIANDAFAKGVAVQQEYNLRQQTAEGYMERANNIWKEAFTNTDGVDTVKSLTQEWYYLSKAIEDSGIVFTEMKITLWLLIHAMEALLLIAPAVIQFFAAKYLVQWIMSMSQSVSSTWALVTAKTADTAASEANTAATTENAIAEGENATATRGAAVAQEGLNTAQKANIFGAIITLALTLVGAYIALKDKTKAVSAEQRSLTDAMGKYKQSVNATTYEAKMYFDAIRKAAEGTKEKEAAIRNANKALAPYLKGISLEHKSLSQLADAYQLVCTRIRQKLALQVKEDTLNKVVKPRLQWEAQRGLEYDTQLNKNPGNHKAQNSDWLYGVLSDAYSKGMDQKQALQLVRTQGNFNVSDRQLQSAYANRSAPYYGYVRGSYSGGKSVFNGVTKGYGYSKDSNYQDQQLMWRAARLASQMYSTRNKQTGINNTFDKIIGDYTEDDETQNFTVVNRKTKEELAEERKARAEARKEHNEKVKALREKLEQAKEGSDALIGNIEEWYNIQEAAVEKAVVDGKIMSQDGDALTREIEKQKNILLGNARYAIAGEKNNFSELAKNMDKGILTDDSTVASNTLKTIQNTDTKKLHDKMAQFEGTGVEGINAGSYLNDIKAKGAGNLRDAAKSDAKITEEVQKMDDYFSTITSAGDILAKGLEEIGISLSSADEVAQKVLGHEPGSASGSASTGEKGNFATTGPLAGDHQLGDVPIFGSRKGASSAEEEIMQKWISRGMDNYKYNPSDADGIEKWFRDFATDAEGRMEDWVKNSGRYQRIFDLMMGQGSGMNYEQSRAEFEKNIKVLKAFYSKLEQSEDQYYQKLREKTEFHSKWLESFLLHSGYTKRIGDAKRDAQQKFDYNRAGGITDLGSTGEMGLTSTSTYVTSNEGFQKAALNVVDAQKQLEDAKLKAKDNADYIKKYTDALIDAEYAYINSMSAAMSSQIDALLKFIEPMKSAAEQVGELLGTLVTEGKWDSDSFRDIMGNMTKSYADMCLQMISDETMRQLRIQLLHKQEEDDSKTHQDETTSIAETGNKAKVAVENVASDQITKALTKGEDKKKKTKKKSADEGNKIEKDSADKSVKVQTVLEDGLSNATSSIGDKVVQQKKVQATENAATEGAETKGSVFAGIAKGAAKIIGELGPWGAPLIAVITGLLMGLLNKALAALFGGGGESEKSTTNTKLKTGMLTYDRGNVRQFGGMVRALAGGEVIGTDGQVYRATASADRLSTGLITQPTTTMVNGLPSIVGEKGPEMVIGRETTRAMMLNAPALLQTIVQFDKYHSGAFRPLAAGDMGGLDSLAGNSSAALASQQQGASGMDADTAKQLTAAIHTLVGQLQQPITAQINKYGRGGLVDEVKSGLAYSEKYGVI